MNVIDSFIMLFSESAPYLLLGMLIAGFIHVLLPSDFVHRLLGGQSSGVLTAAVIGAPLPLCSCSVIPVAMGVRRSGASKASTASFLVSTPETGVDSIGITYALMGPIMAIARPISAVFSAIVTGFAIALWGKKEEPQPVVVQEAKSCCHGGTHKDTKPAHKSLWQKGQAAVVYGFDQLLADFMTWLLIGLVFASLIVAFVPQDWMASYGSGPIAMLLMVLISIPMYICATASTPIAVGLMLAGVSPGAALVFMLTGPATNIATLMVIKKELGTRELGIYLVTLISSALVCGLVLDSLFNHFDWSLALSNEEHSMAMSLLHTTSAVILALLMAYQVFKKVKVKLQTQETKSCCH